MRPILRMGLVVLVLAMTGLAVVAEPRFGGQAAIDERGEVEFAFRDDLVRLWVRTPTGQVVPGSELKGRALILVGASRHDVDLIADGESLTAEVPLRAEDRAAAVVIIEGKGGSRVARFGQSAYIEPRLDPKATKGREVFRESCAACHGTALRGTDSGPPLLHSFYTLGSGHGDGVILDAIRKGAKAHHWAFGDMPEPDATAANSAEAILAYIRAAQAANPVVATATNSHQH